MQKIKKLQKFNKNDKTINIRELVTKNNLKITNSNYTDILIKSKY